ncbi:MAG: cupin domain-containing protein, partial [Armatimonadota bacterium]
YLLTPDTFSAMHRLKFDEIFHFYAGDAVEMLHLYPDGSHQVVLLGNNVGAGQRPQVIVPAGVWQGCRIADTTPAPFSTAAGGRVGYALMGTTVAPGFRPEDYEHGDRHTLIARYPHCAQVIERLTEA